MVDEINIGFVILHYITSDDTIKCIESIFENVKNAKYRIVVVDNNSPNNSFEILREKYFDESKVILLKNNTNLGFAKGNNVGYSFLKNNYKVDFIVLLNNDTYLIKDDFYKLLSEEYLASKFDVMGPKILLPNNKVNPIQERLPTLKEFNKIAFRYKIIYICTFFYIDKLYELFKKIVFKFLNYKPTRLYSDKEVDIRKENVVLHGAFLIFSQNYIKLFDGLEDRTFLYMEEKILAARLMNYNMKSVYNPKIVIFHNEDSSTNALKNNKRKKKLFLYKNAIKSSKILKEYLKKIK